MKTLSYEEALEVQKTAKFAIAANEIKKATLKLRNAWNILNEQFPLDPSIHYSEMLYWGLDEEDVVKIHKGLDL